MHIFHTSSLKNLQGQDSQTYKLTSEQDHEDKKLIMNWINLDLVFQGHIHKLLRDLFISFSCFSSFIVGKLSSGIVFI